MQICFVSKVSTDQLDAYRQAHANVWPEMLEALRDTGWHGYRLYLGADGLLVGVVEVDSYEQAQTRMAALPVNAKWQSAMAELFESDGNPDEGMVLLDEIFNLDNQLAALGLPTTDQAPGAPDF
ncbi:MAG: L-rhamnose mutarotase [Bifidobacteriaceae bacterium]|jgi:L-rhamnose mutarotase|nr:L-rhamnose mutarotase [Bifidobacteriaceae bacterium]